MKKVLFVLYSMKYGGAERSLANLLQTLPEGKYDVDVLLFQRTGDFLKQVPEWINVLETPRDIVDISAPIKQSLWRGTTKVVGTLCSRLARRSRKEQTAWRWKYFYSKKIKPLPVHYDVAVAYAGCEHLYFVRDKVSADRKLVWIHNDYRSADYSPVDDAPYFADMDEIVSVSDKCVDVLKEIFPQFADRMHCIENITSSSSVKKLADECWPEEFDKNILNILSVGRLHPQKGFDIAIKAAAILKKSGLNFKWYIIGKGTLQNDLERQMKESGVEDCFILLGTRFNPYPYIKNCEMIVQPSRTEGKSVVLDEAKILCTPIVASNYVTVYDQIKEGDEGIITEMSPEGIAQGILEMVGNKELYRHIKEYLSMHEYGNEKEIEKYMMLLDKE